MDNNIIRRRRVDCGESRTQQHFADEADINRVMRRVVQSGQPVVAGPGAPRPVFGDFSSLPDYQSALNRVIEVRNFFASLPAAIRSRFYNEPFELLRFVADPSNHNEAARMGLIDHALDVVYRDSDGVDITDQVCATRGLYVRGKRVNRDGSPWVDPRFRVVKSKEEIKS